MKVFTFCIVVLLVYVLVETHAGVIYSNIVDDIVALYHFNTETDGAVKDYGANGVNAYLLDGASLTEGRYGKSLSLAGTSQKFAALNSDAFVESLNKFSIVAWVKIPKQTDDFYLTAGALQPAAPKPTTIGIAQLVVKTDGNLKGIYADVEDAVGIDIETTDQNINDGTWHHIAFTVSLSHIKLYLDGEPIAEKAVTGFTSFVGDQTFISIGKDAMGSVDDVGFFTDNFTDAHIKLIHDVGLESIISIASVEASDKVTTTWGALKLQ